MYTLRGSDIAIRGCRRSSAAEKNSAAGAIVLPATWIAKAPANSVIAATEFIN